jgi:hypothetical protein
MPQPASHSADGITTVDIEAGSLDPQKRGHCTTSPAPAREQRGFPKRVTQIVPGKECCLTSKLIGDRLWPLICLLQ